MTRSHSGSRRHHSAREPGSVPADTPRDGGPRDTLRVLADESIRLVRASCSTRVGVRALEQIADRDPALLDAAADRCDRVTDLDPRVRQMAAELLRRAAAEIRVSRRSTRTGTIRI